MFLRFSLLVAAMCALYLSAGPGDTFTVNTHNKVVIKTNPAVGNTKYYGWGSFPKSGTRYQKAWAELTFKCAPGLKCGEWDYLNYMYLVKRRGAVNDSLGWEIMRMITPYGFYWDNTWKHTWVFDITDFAHLLHDSVQIMYMHTGYEGNADRGWEISLDFKLVEGTPWRDVKNITRFYTQSTGYGNDSLWDARVPEKAFTLGPETDMMRLKILQTGHGMDKPENCSEFCPKRRRIIIDGKLADEQYVWRDDCGENPVYPQAGTWVYDRAGWCPGAEVREYNLDVPATPGSAHTWDLDMETYTTTSGGANYMLSSYLVEYGAPNFTVDAAIEDIINPSDQLRYKRINPNCSEPRIVVGNRGGKAITSLHFLYGIRGKQPATWYWTGHIEPGKSDTIDLPAGFDWGTDPKYFDVKIVWANNAPDFQENNNFAVSAVGSLPPVLPQRFIIVCITNKAPSENSWVIRDANQIIVKSRLRYPAAQTIYRDTVDLPDGCYTFDFQDTGVAPSAYALNEDGLDWWANTYDGSGSLQLRTTSNGLIYRFNADFGSHIRYGFRVGNFNAPRPVAEKPAIWPNPAHDALMLDFSTLPPEKRNGELSIEMHDMRGRQVLKQSLAVLRDPMYTLDIAGLSQGVYHLKVVLGDTVISERIIKE